MQKIISKTDTGKDIYKIDKKQKVINTLNQWLSKVGKTLNTSQLSNYK